MDSFCSSLYPQYQIPGLELHGAINDWIKELVHVLLLVVMSHYQSWVYESFLLPLVHTAVTLPVCNLLEYFPPSEEHFQF